MTLVKEYQPLTYSKDIVFSGTIITAGEGLAGMRDGELLLTTTGTPALTPIKKGAIVTISGVTVDNVGNDISELNGNAVVSLDYTGGPNFFVWKPVSFTGVTSFTLAPGLVTVSEVTTLAAESKEASGLNVESNIITSAALSSSWNGTSMKFNNTALWNTDYGNVLRKEN